MVNDLGTVIHKLRYKKGLMHDYDFYKETHLNSPKGVLNVFDLGSLGVEKDFHE